MMRYRAPMWRRSSKIAVLVLVLLMALDKIQLLASASSSTTDAEIHKDAAPDSSTSSTCIDTAESSSCSPQNDWKWKPQAEHRCNIPTMTYEQVYHKFGPTGVPPLHPFPLVIRGDPYNEEFRNLTTKHAIVDNMPLDFQVTLSSSNSYSTHRRVIALTQYLEELSYNNGETLPDQLSNETWYLFGETYTDEWQHLLSHYHLPPCTTCTRDLSALSFGIGNKGSGVQWHSHGPGFSESLHGRKHWVLYKHQPQYHPDYTSRHWMEYTYTKLSERELPFECTLSPGDLIYFPDGWFHATINLDPYTAFVSTFTTEHEVM